MDKKESANDIEEQNERISQIFKEYDNQGFHRTGSKVDILNADWLANRIKALGLVPKLEGFYINRIDIKDSSLTLENLNIEGLPLFDSISENDVEIIGKLGRFNSSTNIGVNHISSDRILMKERLSNRHEGLVVFKRGVIPGLIPINAEYFKKPFSPPVLQLANDLWPMLKKKLNNIEEGTLSIKFNRIQEEVFNVMTRVEGKKKNLKPLIVVTPRSGWWHCASERGGGIACILEIMREMCSVSPERDVIFLLTTGHELGYLGAEKFIESNPKLVKDAHVWIHLGANFAASSLPQFGIEKTPIIITQASDEKLENVCLKFMNATNLIPYNRIPIGVEPKGEVRNFFTRKERYFSILGTNPLFHHPNDRWPIAVDLDKTSKIIQIMISICNHFASKRFKG
jgi:hypothetical protein